MNELDEAVSVEEEIGRSSGLTQALGDLDGDRDGLNDLLFETVSYADEVPPPPELIEAGELYIWYGKDLVDAYEAALPTN